MIMEAINMNKYSVLTQVNISLMNKQMDQMELQSKQLTEMSKTTNVVSNTKLDVSL